MAANRILLSSVLIVLASVIQASILARLHLPGAVPDLVLLVVVALAITYGPVGGCLAGFGAGILTDLAPPADHAVGRFALVLCLIGYLAGLFKPESGQVRSASRPMLVVAAAAVASTFLYAAVGSLVGDTAARSVGMLGLVSSALLYDLLLAPFTVPWIMALARKVDNDPMAANLGDPGGTTTTGASSGWLSSASGQGGGRFGTTGRLNGTGRVRGGLLRAGRGPRIGWSPRIGRGAGIGRQRGAFGRSFNRTGLGKLGKRP